MSDPPRPIPQGVDCVRLRPAMYIGNTGQYGLHSVLDGVVAVFLEAVARGKAVEVEVTLHTDGSVSVAADGPGLPDPHYPGGAPCALEEAFLHMRVLLIPPDWGWGWFCSMLYSPNVVGPLSEWLEVTVRREGKIDSRRFERGRPAGPARGEGLPEGKNSLLRWLPDPEILPGVSWEADRIANRLRTLACLEPGCRLLLVEEASGQTRTFFHPGGVADLLEPLVTGETAAHPLIRIEAREEWGELSLALQYHHGDLSQEEDAAGLIFSYANHRQVFNGTHLGAFRDALQGVFHHYARHGGALPADEPEFTARDLQSGLRAVLSVRVPHPQFEGPTATAFGNQELRAPMCRAIRGGLEAWLQHHPKEWERVVQAVRGARSRRNRQTP